MRILLVTHYFSTHGGGIEKVAGILAESLAAQFKKPVTWVASDCDAPPETLAVRAISASTWNITERKLGFPYPIWSPLSLIHLWHEVHRAEALCIHESLYMGCVAAAVMAKIQKKPVILTQHVGFIPYESPVLRTLLKLANRSVARLTMACATERVFISRNVQDYFSGLFPSSGPAHFIPNGVDAQCFFAPLPGQSAEARASLGVAPDEAVFLFVGRFVEKKGLSQIQVMAKSFPQAQFWLAGHGEINPMHWGLSNVRVFSGRAGQTLRPLYWAATALLLPSVGEGFPLVIQEAMACGLQVLTTEENAKAYPAAQGLIHGVPASAEARGPSQHWREAIGQEIDAAAAAVAGDASGAALRAIGVAERAQFAAQHWSWSQAANQYAELLRRNLKTPPTHSPDSSQ